MPLFLSIDPENDHYWKTHPTYNKAVKNGDVGLDIPMQESVIIPSKARSFKINLKFKASPTHGYMLVPRSSISKTSELKKAPLIQRCFLIKESREIQ